MYSGFSCVSLVQKYWALLQISRALLRELRRFSKVSWCCKLNKAKTPKGGYDHDSAAFFKVFNRDSMRAALHYTVCGYNETHLPTSLLALPTPML